MVTIAILKRRDAASIIVAIVLGLIGSDVVTAISSSLADGLSGAGVSFTSGYFVPILAFVLQLILLEVGLRAIILLRAAYLKSQ